MLVLAVENGFVAGEVVVDDEEQEPRGALVEAMEEAGLS